MFSEEKYLNYIKGIDISNIDYINLTNIELRKFYIDNYYDSKTGTFAESYDDSLGWSSPIGMYYLNFSNMPGMKYILGVVNNNINKKTIVSALIYCDEYKIAAKQKKFITYLSTVETNMYFRNRGLYRDLIIKAFNFIDQDQNILISEISDMGKCCHVYDSFIKIFRDRGFYMDIRNESYIINNEMYLDYLNNPVRIKSKNKS